MLAILLGAAAFRLLPACAWCAAEQQAQPPTKAAVDRAKIEHIMNLQEEIGRSSDELEPLVERLSALRSLYPRTCALRKLAAERERTIAEITSRFERLGAAVLEVKNLSRAGDILAVLSAKIGPKPPRSAPEVYLDESVRSCIGRFARVKSGVEMTLADDERAFQAAAGDCAARKKRLGSLAGVLILAVLLGLFAWWIGGRRALCLAFLFLAAQSGAAADVAERSVDRNKIERVMKLRDEADRQISELEPLVSRLAEMGRAYAATCRFDAVSAERERLRSELLNRHLRLASVKKNLFDLRRADIFLSLMVDQRRRESVAANLRRRTPLPSKASPPPEEADSYFVKSFDGAMLRVLDAGDRAWRVIREDDAAFKAAQDACAERRSRRIPLYGALAGVLIAAAVLWRFLPRS